MKRATAHAMRERPRSLSDASTLPRGCTGARRLSCGAHTTSPRTARAAHAPSDPRHPSAPPAATASGTLAPAASVAPSPIADEYRLVIGPTRSGKSRLTREGSSTLPSAMPTPSTAVPPNSSAVPGTDRTSTPTAISASASPSAPSTPSRRVATGVSAETRPNASSGSVVSSPSAVFERPVASRIAATSGPTAASAGRRFRATSAIPATSSARVGRTEADVDIQAGGEARQNRHAQPWRRSSRRNPPDSDRAVTRLWGRRDGAAGEWPSPRRYRRGAPCLIRSARRSGTCRRRGRSGRRRPAGRPCARRRTGRRSRRSSACSASGPRRGRRGCPSGS